MYELLDQLAADLTPRTKRAKKTVKKANDFDEPIKVEKKNSIVDAAGIAEDLEHNFAQDMADDSFVDSEDIDMVLNIPPNTPLTNSPRNDAGEQIGFVYENAPEAIPITIINFKATNKPIKMKQLKMAFQQVIHSQLANGDRKTMFSDVYHHLPEHCSTEMAQRITPSLALLAVLHLCNESSMQKNKFKCEQTPQERSMANDFSINLINGQSQKDI